MNCRAEDFGRDGRPEAPEASSPRWSVIRDVLGWIE
jgi:hypothetical protein